MTQISRRLLLVMFIAAGLVSGAAAVLFHEWVVLSRRLLLDRALHTTGPLRAALLIAIPSVTAATLGWIVQRHAPRTLGANLSRVRRAYAEDEAHLDPRTVLFTFLLTPLSLGSGTPLGPEGPTIIVTSGLSVWVARVLKLPKKVLRGMVPVGTAAGIAAIFRTPITGVVFALEELFGTSSRSILGGTLIAAVAAAVVQQATSRDHARILPAAAAGWSHAGEMIGFAVVGVCAGIFSGAMLRAAAVVRDRFRNRVPSVPLRFAIGGACVGLLGVVNPAMLGVGYETTSLLLRGGGSLLFDGGAFGAKALGFFIAASAGLLGGTFAPSLFIGAALGGTVGQAAHLIDAHVNPGAYALVGMGAYFAGTLRAPIAAVLIVLELTNDYGLVVPLMLGVALSNLISHAIAPLTLEEDQLEREGFREPPAVHDPLAAYRVEEVMSPAPIAFTRETPLAEVIERTRDLRHRIYPVVDERHRLIAQLSGDRITDTDGMAEDRMEPVPVAARTTETVHELLARMHAAGVDRCPVVDAADVVVGFVSPSDLVRARFRRQAEAESEL